MTLHPILTGHRKFAPFLCALLLFLLLYPAQGLAQLSGTYTIGSGGTYSNFRAAVSALTSQGVSGAVTFNVLPGTYTEHITIPAITGSGPTHVITFQSSTSNAADVTLGYTAASTDSNYVVKINGASYLKFHKMVLVGNTTSGAPYCMVFNLNGAWDNLTIDSTTMTGATNVSGTNQALIVTATASSATSCIINGNTFLNGAYGIFIGGTNPSSLMAGVQITNNTFSGQYGHIYCTYLDAPQLIGNTMTGTSSTYSVELDNCQKGIQFLKNKVTSSGSNTGVYFYSCAGGAGTLGNPPRALVANNFFSTTGNGYGMNIYNCSNFDIYYNAVNMNGTSTSNSAFYQSAGSGNTVNVENNIFANMGGGYAYDINTPANIGTSDYNDLYSPGNYLAAWGPTSYLTLSSLQSASSQEANSHPYNPMFVSATDLHVMSPWINGKATPLASVSDDIDGQARNVSTPDIGADEFTPGGGTTTPLAGTYTIGSGGTYTTFKAAVSDLLLKGVSAAVTFNVLTGTYNEHIVLTPIPGSNSSNVVTFQANTGVAANVTLYYLTAASTDSNYVVKINGASNLRFHKMVLQANNNPAAAYCMVFNLIGGWDNLTIDSAVIGGSANTTGGNQALVNTSTGSVATSCLIYGNTFTNGGYGVALSGTSSVLMSGLQITQNTFTGLYNGIYVDYADSPIMDQNSISGSSSAAIEVDNSRNGIQITKSKITMPAGYGIYCYSCVGGAGTLGNPPRALVANNFVSTTGNGTGIYAYNNGNFDYFYNTVNMNGTSTTNAAFYQTAGSGNSVNVENNIFANMGGGYAYDVNTPAAIGTSNYNDFYTPGNYIGGWGPSSYIMLSDLQAASSQDANSVPYNPMFVSATDLHVTSPWIDGKGTPVATVSDDIDGQVRNGSTPDIGADEFTPAVGTTTPLAGTYTIGTTGATYKTFKAAVTDLLLKGVSGAVTFNVLTGTYNEHIVITPIPGSNSSNVVTFQANTGIAANVTLYYLTAASTDSNYVVKINGASNLRFHKMVLQANNNPGATYCMVFNLTGGWDNLVIDSAGIGGSANTTGGNQALVNTSAGSVATSCLIYGNSFTNGGYGVALSGTTSVLMSGLQITQNTFTGLYNGIVVDYADSPLIDQNTLNGSSSSAIEVDYSRNGIQITKNKITMPTGYGIYCYSCTGGAGTLGNPPRALVANNFVSTTGNGTGIYTYADANFDYFYNTVNMNGTSTTNAAFYQSAGSGNNVNVENNIFANMGGGYAYDINTPASIGTSDYNDFYTPGNFIAGWGNSSYITLSAFQAASSQDANSVPYNPMFVSGTDLHATSPWINAEATPVATVSDDIDGQTRNGSTPDIGADEFTPAPGSTPPLAGPYTIGTGGNYTTFKAAVSDLLLRGVSAPVTFNVLNGSYNEHILLTPIPGSDTTKTVTFQANSGNPANVTLLYLTAASTDSNYVVKLNGAENLRFQKMMLQANNNSGASFCTVFNLIGGWDNLTIDSTIITGATNTTSSNQALIITNTGSVATRCSIYNNLIANGGYGIALGGTTAYMSGVQITQNVFSGCYYGIYLNYQNSPVVDQNVMTGITNTGVEFDNSVNAIQVTRSRMTLSGSGYGIYFNSENGGNGGVGNPPRGLITDNMVVCTGTATGIYLYNCSNIDVYYNSVNLLGASASSAAMYQYANPSGHLNIVNNIFANPGGGYAYYISTTGGVDTSDYNDYYTTGTTLAYWNGSQAALSNLRSANSKDAHSISVNPGFFSPTNLYTISSDLDSMGTPVASVTTDIDGKPRDLSKPDVGAAEFSQITTFTQPIANYWNLISLPVTVADASLHNLYPAADTKAYEYGSGGYVVKDTVGNRLGYWIKYSTNVNNPITGKLRIRDTIPVSTGWNLMGSISYPVPSVKIIQVPLGIINNTIFKYDPATGYRVADSIKSGFGYWVRTGAAGSLILDVAQTSIPPAAAGKKSEAVDLDQLNVLTIHQAPGNSSQLAADANLYFSNNADVGKSIDQFDLPPVPPSPGFDIRYSTNRFVEFFDGTDAQEVPIVFQGVSGTVRLSWDLKENSFGKYTVVERTNGNVSAEYPLAGSGSVAIHPSGETTYSLKTAHLPVAFTLLQNYPNPFNPTTRIAFTLGKESTVSLKIFNILGQEVSAPIQHQTMERGLHTVDVDAHAWVSGVYFYRITAGAFTDVKKMVLLK